MASFVAYVAVLCLVVELLNPTGAVREWSSIGINYGRMGSNLPSSAESISLMKSLKVGKVKLYDSDPQVLNALANSGLSIVISVKNEDIPTIASSVLKADEWVKHNVLAHYPATKITTITVGNEVLSDYNNQNRWLKLVPAMQNIHSSLVRWNLDKRIKVTTSVAMDCLKSSSPPSSGQFRDDIAETVMKSMLRFLSNTKSFYFVNIYPYFAWSANADKIPLEYAIFGEVKAPVEDGALQYTDMLSAQLDANVAAMAKLGYPNLNIAISETGWPTAGEEVGANVDLAATYNRRVVARMLASPPLGTPRRPRAFIPTYIFSLFNEDNKPGPLTERNWGLLYPNGSQVYPIDMTGKLSDSEFKSLKSVRPFPALPTPLSTPIHSSINTAPPLSGTGQNPTPYYSAAPLPQPFADPYPPSKSPIPPILPYPPPSTMPVYSSPPPPTVNYPPPCVHYPPTNPAPYIPSPTPPITTPPYPPSNPTVPYTPNPPSTTPSYALWCVAKPTVPNSALQKAMDYACGTGADCKSVQPNGPCYLPDTVMAHASYAFNSYWQKNKRIGGTCDFGGTAMLIAMDPSYETCHFGLN